MHVLSTPPAFILSQDQTLRCSSSPLGSFIKQINCFTHSPQLELLITHLQSFDPTVGATSSDRSVQRVQTQNLSTSTLDFPESQIRLRLLRPLSIQCLSPREKDQNIHLEAFIAEAFASKIFDGTSHLHCSLRPGSQAHASTTTSALTKLITHAPLRLLTQ